MKGVIEFAGRHSAGVIRNGQRVSYRDLPGTLSERLMSLGCPRKIAIEVECRNSERARSLRTAPKAASVAGLRRPTPAKISPPRAKRTFDLARWNQLCRQRLEQIMKRVAADEDEEDDFVDSFNEVVRATHGDRFSVVNVSSVDDSHVDLLCVDNDMSDGSDDDLWMFNCQLVGDQWQLSSPPMRAKFAAAGRSLDRRLSEARGRRRDIRAQRNLRKRMGALHHG